MNMTTTPRSFRFVLTLALATLWWVADDLSLVAAEADAPAPPQGAALLKTDIMGVFAHPDDETGVAATMAHYALGRGKVVAHVYCTRGEGGGNMVGTQAGPALGILREAELKDCLSILGVRHGYFLDRLDWAYTESSAATLKAWGKEETLERLVRLVRALRPEVIVTMNPAPSPGQHGHHQAAGILATEAFEAAADPRRFPDQLSVEGLTVWQPRKLYYRGGTGITLASIETTIALPDGRTPADVAAEALSHHRSQAFGNFRDSPWLRRPQTFTLVKSVIPFVKEEDDLWRGLPLKDRAAPPSPMIPVSANGGALVLDFTPRPAVARYREWVARQNIGHVAGEFPADIPVVAGDTNLVRFQLRNESPRALAGSIVLRVPEGWKVQPARLSYELNPEATWQYLAQVHPPANAIADVEITAVIEPEAGASLPVLQAKAILHPVPRIGVPRLATPPSLDGSDRGWESVPSHIISPEHRVQGRTEDASDHSGVFRLAHDGNRLYVDIRINDDRVVRNIAPNDIRGHWRSDSVEICVDPQGGAEDTLNSFKLGIFPFDSTGRVRAARDADAKPGPVEKTAPGTQLVSRATEGGYRIQASIPFLEMGTYPNRGQELGFNLILYDGDKRDAAMGENINESRLAWSPRRGVQGRPEDWGRIVLE